MIPLWISLWFIHSYRYYCLTLGGKKRSPADFKPAKLVLLAFLDPVGRVGLGFTFFLSCGFVKMGTRSRGNIHSCPVSSPGPQSTAGPPLSVCARPLPLIHYVVPPGGALIGSTWQPTSSFFCGLGPRRSYSPFKVV